jgi:hypothetical protein
MRVHHCTGKPPSTDKDIAALKTIRLSTYNHEELHLLLQCEGFTYSNVTAASAAAAAGIKLPYPAMDSASACNAIASSDSQRPAQAVQTSMRPQKQLVSAISTASVGLPMVPAAARGQERWWHFAAIIFAAVLTCAALARCALKGVPSIPQPVSTANAMKSMMQRQKLKKEDENAPEETEML